MSEEFGESATDLIERARALGADVTRDQLRRWHRAELLPRPVVKGLGRGRGTEAVYPVGTFEQLMSLIRSKEKDRRLSGVGWRMWLEGWPVEEFMRNHFSEVLAEAEEQLFDSLKRFKASEAQDSGPNFNNPISRAKDRDDDFGSTEMRLSLEMIANEPALGTHPPVPTDKGDIVDGLAARAQQRDKKDAELARRRILQLGLAEAGFRFETPWPADFASTVSALLAEALDLHALRQYMESLPDERLREYRDRARSIQARWGSEDLSVLRKTFLAVVLFSRLGIDLLPVIQLLEGVPELDLLVAPVREASRGHHSRGRRRIRTLDTRKLPADSEES